MMKMNYYKSLSKTSAIFSLLLSVVFGSYTAHAEVIERHNNGSWQSVLTQKDHKESSANEAKPASTDQRNKEEKTYVLQGLDEKSSPVKVINTQSNTDASNNNVEPYILNSAGQTDNVKTLAQNNSIENVVSNHPINETVLTYDAAAVEIIGIEPIVKANTNFAAQNETLNSATEVKTKKQIKKNKPRRTAKKLRKNKPRHTDTFAKRIAPVKNATYKNASLLSRRDAFVPIILAAAEEYKLDPDLIDAIMWQESRYRDSAHSHAGAIGLMQLMPATARHLGVDPYDNWQNVFGGAAYFRRQLNRFKGNLSHALAAYNAGPGAVRRYRGIPPYRETQNYVKAITKRYAMNKTIRASLKNNFLVNSFYSNNPRKTENEERALANGNERDNYYRTLVYSLKPMETTYFEYGNFNNIPKRKKEEPYILAIFNRLNFNNKA